MADQNIGKVLQDDENFHVEVVDWRGKVAVKKMAKPTANEDRQTRIKIDVQGMEFFRKLANDNPSLDLYVPELYEHGDNYYIREYIDSPVVADQSMSFDESKPRVEKLAKLLADIDRLEPAGPEGYKGSSNYRNLAPSIERWVHDNLEEGLFDHKQADRAKEISKGLDKYLQPRIAHGDMSAYKHTYIHRDRIAMIDFEIFSTKAARYYDAAWCYTRMYGLGSPELAKHFLATFLDKAEKTENQTEQLMAVFIQRAVGLQKDAQGDAKKGNDYRKKAQELLNLVLMNDLKLLYN